MWFTICSSDSAQTCALNGHSGVRTSGWRWSLFATTSHATSTQIGMNHSKATCQVCGPVTRNTVVISGSEKAQRCSAKPRTGERTGSPEACCAEAVAALTDIEAPPYERFAYASVCEPNFSHTNPYVKPFRGGFAMVQAQ